MSQRLEAVRGPLPWYKNAGKLVTAAASTGAACVSIFSFLYSYGIVGEAESHKSIGNIGAAWVGVRPASDTAASIGDTLHLAATITDRNGAVLIGARPAWTSESPDVATVLADGSVIAQGPGRATITVAVGTLFARAHILVRQRVAAVEVRPDSGDTTLVVPESDRRLLRAVALDARGHVVSGQAADWHADDSTVASLDSSGAVTGRLPGRTIVTATIAGVSGHGAVTVVSAPSAITAMAGASQRAAAGAPLPQPVVVRITSRRGRPVEGTMVRFRLADGQGRLTTEAVLTDADGRARTGWTLGDAPGRQTLLASVEHVDSALAIVAEAEPVAANTHVNLLGELPSARAGEKLPAPIGVRLTDSTGRALSDVVVAWVALDGGTVEPLGPRTDSLGTAQAWWTLGAHAGTQRLRVQVGSGHGAGAVRPLTLAARAMAGAPVTLAATGDAQRGTVGATLAKPVVLRVLDATGNGVADVPIALAPAAGTVPDTAVTTDSLGEARVRWTLGRATGDQTLAARVEGIKRPLRLTAHALPGRAANVSFDDPSITPKVRGTQRVVAVVTDEFGNPVPDARVRLKTTSGRVSPERAVTDSRGRVAVTWTHGAAGGEQSVTARVGDSDVSGTFVAQLEEKAAPKAPVRTVSRKKSGKR